MTWLVEDKTNNKKEDEPKDSDYKGDDDEEGEKEDESDKCISTSFPIIYPTICMLEPLGVRRKYS